MALPEHVKKWFIPLDRDDISLGQAFREMEEISLDQDSIPLMVKIVENPNYNLPGVEIFSGSTDLKTHDYIHLLLGRGVLPKDEAFVLGFTMGSTNRIGVLEERLYGLFSRYLYPKVYRFTKDDFQVYKDAVRLAYVSNCVPLHEVDYPSLSDLTLREAREKLGLETDLLSAYYRIEKKRYPDSYESQRL